MATATAIISIDSRPIGDPLQPGDRVAHIGPDGVTRIGTVAGGWVDGICTTRLIIGGGGGAPREELVAVSWDGVDFDYVPATALRLVRDLEATPLDAGVEPHGG